MSFLCCVLVNQSCSISVYHLHKNGLWYLKSGNGTCSICRGRLQPTYQCHISQYIYVGIAMTLRKGTYHEMNNFPLISITAPVTQQINKYSFPRDQKQKAKPWDLVFKLTGIQNTIKNSSHPSRRINILISLIYEAICCCNFINKLFILTGGLTGISHRS